MELPIKKSVCRPVTQVDEADCAINWELFECLGCHGAGAVRDTHPESETYGDEYDCDECDGTGRVALLKR